MPNISQSLFRDLRRRSNPGISRSYGLERTCAYAWVVRCRVRQCHAESLSPEVCQMIDRRAVNCSIGRRYCHEELTASINVHIFAGFG